MHEEEPAAAERRPPARRSTTVCLFGLSADPPTGTQGHVGIVQALRQLNEWDELWVLPVYRHTFTDKRNRLVSFEHRLAMCQAAFGDLSSSTSSSKTSSKTKVVVSDAELHSWKHAVKDISDEREKANVSVGTAALLNYLKSKVHDNKMFSFCLGADAFLDLMDGKWKESARVLELLDGGKRLVVLHRSSSLPPPESTTSSDDDDKKNDDTVLLRRVEETGARLMRIGRLGSISSSQVRVCSDTNELSTMVVPRVLDYMRANHLYQFSSGEEDDR